VSLTEYPSESSHAQEDARSASDSCREAPNGSRKPSRVSDPQEETSLEKKNGARHEIPERSPEVVHAIGS
jgi:hypothetical protein